MNNKYFTNNKVVASYRSTVPYSFSGFRLDPDTGNKVTFILASKKIRSGLDNLGAAVIVSEFDEDNQVIDLYSDDDHSYFLKANSYLLSKGLLAPYTPASVNSVTVYSDEDIEDIASTRKYEDLTSKLAAVANRVTVQRILDCATTIGRPIRAIDIIKNRLNELT